MGTWLKKYGEAVYATRAGEKYGEWPTKMGAAHGVFQAPAEGTAKDVRFTKSKDNTTLYAIFLGWDKGQKDIVLTSLTTDRIDLKNLKSVELINGAARNYLPLTFKQSKKGLSVNLPESSFEEMAYVLRLKFNGKIPPLDKYADINTVPHYYIIPGYKTDTLVFASDLTIVNKKNQPAHQWIFEQTGKGFYKIINRGNKQALTNNGNTLTISEFSGTDNQLWKIENTYYGLYKISGKRFPSSILSVGDNSAPGKKAGITTDALNNPNFNWQFQEVCELKLQPFKPLTIPGTIEAEDFNSGCPGEAYSDRDEINSGGEYRINEGVDVEKYEGGFDITRTAGGEWVTYTVAVSQAGDYQVTFYIASVFDDAKMHLEADGTDRTGAISIPNTGGGQTWKEVKRIIKLDAGKHLLKLAIDNRGVHIDKMVFEEVK